ncbi:MAG: homoserine dehydrogenase [Armatimonadota bacterium]
MKDAINVGVIGFGTVGSGAVQIMMHNADDIARKVGCPVKIKRIADLDITTPRPVEIDKSVLEMDANDIINDPEIDIVVETIGGIKPAGELIRRALEAGKNVVTANKELIAKEGAKLLPLAGKLGKDLMFEASVGGGIPIIRPMKSCLAGNEILEIKGIVNGTTNYILTRMAAEGLNYEDVLPDAQAKGYAEANPTADVEGHDAAYKISILSSIGFTSRVDVTKVYREGITKITADDMKYADRFGYVIKLLAIAKRVNDCMQVRVHPAFLPKMHPLASVNGVFNGIYLKADAVGEVMFYGPGAGSLAAGSAVVGDVIDTARNVNSGSTSRISCTCFDNRKLLGMDSVVSKNYVRIIGEDKPRMLAAITTVFADHNVSIANAIQNAQENGCGETVWLTHEAAEPNMKKALDAIRALPVVKEIAGWIRVEE